MGTISGSGKSLAVLGSLAPGNSAGTITVGSGLAGMMRWRKRRTAKAEA
jgi:hypothetical protein